LEVAQKTMTGWISFINTIAAFDAVASAQSLVSQTESQGQHDQTRATKLNELIIY